MDNASALDDSRTGAGAGVGVDLVFIRVLNPDDGSFLKRAVDLTRQILSLRDELL